MKQKQKSCWLYVNLVTEPFCWRKMKLLKIAVCCIPNHRGKKLTWNYIIFNDKGCSATIQITLSKRREKRITVKRGLMTQNSSVRIVYKDSFKNFYHQMTMLFLAYVVTILGQLHFTGNYIFVVNISASELLP